MILDDRGLLFGGGDLPFHSGKTQSPFEDFQDSKISDSYPHEKAIGMLVEGGGHRVGMHGAGHIPAYPFEGEAIRPLEPLLRDEYAEDDIGKVVELWLRSWQMVSDRSAKEELFAARTHGEVLSFLKLHDLERPVGDYSNYIKWRQEELEEGESPGIILQSLQSWAWFLVDYAKPKGLPYTKLKADFDGCARLAWRLSDRWLHSGADSKYWGNGHGIATLKFYPSNLNYFSMLSGPFASERRRLTLEGYLSHERTCQVINMYAERFLHEEE